MRHTATIIIWGYIPTASVVPIQQTNTTKGKKMYQLEYLILQNVFNAKPKGEKRHYIPNSGLPTIRPLKLGIVRITLRGKIIRESGVSSAACPSSLGLQCVTTATNTTTALSNQLSMNIIKLNDFVSGVRRSVRRTEVEGRRMPVPFKSVKVGKFTKLGAKLLAVSTGANLSMGRMGLEVGLMDEELCDVERNEVRRW